MAYKIKPEVANEFIKKTKKMIKKESYSKKDNKDGQKKMAKPRTYK